MTTPSVPARPSTTRTWRFDPRYLALAFGLVLSLSEVTQAWRRWGLAGLVFTCTGFIPLQLTDVMMPGESGAALAAALRQRRAGLPVLYISGFPGEYLARLGLLEGEVELLRTPFTIRELIDRVREVLSRRDIEGRETRD